MPTEQEIVENAISTYLMVHQGPGLMKECGALETVSEKDAMIDVLEHIRDLFVKEAAKLRRRRNRDHSPLSKLPQELLVEILLLSVDWRYWSVSKLQPLAMVSTSWRDTILSSNRFWSVMDAGGSSEARKVAMKRNPEGAVNMCIRYSGPSGWTSFMNDVKMVQANRMKSVYYELRPKTKKFLDHLQSNNSAVTDLLLFRHDMGASKAHLELSSEGPNLRHLELEGTSLNWESPRLARLRTLSLRELTNVVPRVDQLYTILSSSPELERLCLVIIWPEQTQEFGSIPASAPSINLPFLQTLAFDNVPTPISTNIIPLIRAPGCHMVAIHDGGLAVPLELQETTIELIAKPISISEKLILKMDADDRAYLHIRSEPVPAVARQCVYWARDPPGLNVAFSILSTEILPQVWSVLGGALGRHGGAPRITSLEVEWAGQQFPFPFTLLEHCTALTSLRFVDDSGTTLQPLVQLLGGNRIGGSGVNSEHRFPLPALTTFRFFAKTIPNLEECVSSAKDFLERRYPRLQDGLATGEVQRMNEIRLPWPLVQALQERGVATSLDLKKMVRGKKNTVRPT
ncbi:hypothetical protein FRC01_001575 [Tulasnella sp. 417]|nr:hypothetical protein FRC01_001575 [Tulasnella sp. 417]